jgi:hypothetical protein
MTHETEGTQLKPEVPHHHARVVAARDELLHVWVEAHRGNGILVTAEAPFERGRVRREVGASHRLSREGSRQSAVAGTLCANASIAFVRGVMKNQGLRESVQN